MAKFSRPGAAQDRQGPAAWKRGYVTGEKADSILHYFYVPKGLDDVWIVYNRTVCGLNDVIWAPHFGLPYVSHTLRNLMPGYYQCDLDIW